MQQGKANPTLNSPFQDLPAPFVENAHQPLPLTLASGSARHLRGLPKPHGAISTADDLPAGTVHELGQPANAAHEETRVDVEENDSRVTIGIPPVSHKCGLEERSGAHSVRSGLFCCPYLNLQTPLIATLPRGPLPSPPPRSPRAQPLSMTIGSLPTLQAAGGSWALPPPDPPPTGLPPADQGEESAEARDGPEGRDVAVHVLVLGLGEERVLALDPTALHVLIPTLGVVSPNQGSLTLARTVELDVLHLILAMREEEKAHRGAVGSGDLWFNERREGSVAERPRAQAPQTAFQHLSPSLAPHDCTAWGKLFDLSVSSVS